MPELLDRLPPSFNFSQSSLQDYVECARRFQLRYINRLQWPAIETAPVLENERRQVEGQLFHRLVQQNLLGLPAEKLARLANTPDLSRWWSNFLAHGPDLSSGDQRHTELSLSAPLGAQRLVAKYDLVLVKDGRAIIYDWKTYHKRPKDEWMAARLQTKVYLALLVLAGAHLNGGRPFAPEQVQMVYWYADFPDEPTRIAYTPAEHERQAGELLKLAKEISAKQSFPLTDDEQRCAYCQFRSFCDRGRQAGRGDDPETELTGVDIALEQIQEIEF
jgi:CRISPR/Cas system-associated exonuclease Cas4 (RecB family)